MNMLGWLLVYFVWGVSLDSEKFILNPIDHHLM